VLATAVVAHRRSRREGQHGVVAGGRSAGLVEGPPGTRVEPGRACHFAAVVEAMILGCRSLLRSNRSPGNEEPSMQTVLITGANRGIEHELG
jgi:hypothetical protein